MYLLPLHILFYIRLIVSGVVIPLKILNESSSVFPMVRFIGFITDARMPMAFQYITKADNDAA